MLFVSYAFFKKRKEGFEKVVRSTYLFLVIVCCFYVEEIPNKRKDNEEIPNKRRSLLFD